MTSVNSVLNNVNGSAAASLAHHPLGARIPESTHAVCVSLPTMADVIGYEEGRPETREHVKTGYPRFMRHPYVERAALVYATELGLLGRALYPVCSRIAAQECVNFTGGATVRIDPAPGGWFLISYAGTDTEAAARAKSFLQHTGAQISSREAEDWLVGRGVLPAAQPEALVSGDAPARVREALAPYIAPAGAGDVVLCRAGMAAFHAAYKAARAVQTPKGRKRWVQLGWLYVDTTEIMKKFGAPDESYVLLGDVHDRAGIEAFFAEHGADIAAVVTEFPTNPLLQTADIAWLAALCLKYGVLRLFDPSSAGLVNVDLLPHADLVVASLTKYSGNAGDVMIGAVVVNPAGPHAGTLRRELKYAAQAPYARDVARLAAQIGAMPAVADAINANTVALVRFLETHPAVRRVWWAYSPECAANYAAIARGEARPGALLTLELNGPVARFYDRLRCAKGPSFGTTFTIACPFVYLAHYDLVTTPEGRAKLQSLRLDPELIRVSVGAEPTDALLGVFADALR